MAARKPTHAGQLGERTAGLVEHLLVHPATPWLLAAAFVAHGSWALASDRHLYDEGLLTYVFASWLREAPLATVFFQKAKPLTSLLYAPTTLFGKTGFFVAHLLVAAAAIPMLARIAAKVGHRLPALPALLVAASPMYLDGAPSGISNTDGVVATVGFLYLLTSGRPLLAGIVLGCVPWVRNELMILVVVFVAYGAVWQRRVVAGVMLFPALYLLAGAVYHGQLLWPFAYPPSLTAPMPGNPVYAGELAGFGISKVILTMLAVTPACMLALMVRIDWLRREERALLAFLALMVRIDWLRREERALLAFAAVYFAVMNLLPQWQVFNFGFTPRYCLGLLPALALAGGRVLEAWWRGERLGAATLPALVSLLGAGIIARSSQAVLWLALSASALVALGRTPFFRAGAVAAVVLVLAVAPRLDEAAGISRRAQSPQSFAVESWLRSHRERVEGRPIYTDIAILDTLLPELDVRYLVGADQLYEVEHLSNPRNQQRQRLLEAMQRVYFGEPVLPSELRPASVDNALFVLSTDARLDLIMKDAEWRGRLRPLVRHERFGISELVRPTGQPARHGTTRPGTLSESHEAAPHQPDDHR